MMADIAQLTVVVAGMGPMGRGIARVFRQAGAEVIVSDITPEMTQNGVDTIAAESLADGSPLTVIGSPLDEAVAKADLLVEAIVEKMEAKVSLLQTVAEYGGPSLIVASNTSSLSISQMGEGFGDPSRLVGMHFFNPPTKMDLVEVIRGAATAQGTIEAVTELVKQVDKTPVECADTPNFIVNRICRPLYYEAQLLVTQGVEPGIVDAAATGALGHPMGPLTLLDFTGLHTHLGSSETALREFGDPKYRPIPLTRGLVRGGMTGRSVGRGFYDYSVEKPRVAIARVTREAPQPDGTTVRFLGPDAKDQQNTEAVGDADVTVYACHRDPTQADLDAVRELAKDGPTVVDSSAAGWLGEILTDVDWARVHWRGKRMFVEVVEDEIAGVQPGVAVDLLLKGLGAASVQVPALPGLVADRLADCMSNEAFWVMEEGTAGAEAIDTALRLGMNHSVGPVESARDRGVGSVHARLQSMLAAFGDSRYRPSQLMRRESLRRTI